MVKLTLSPTEEGPTQLTLSDKHADELFEQLKEREAKGKG